MTVLCDPVSAESPFSPTVVILAHYAPGTLFWHILTQSPGRLFPLPDTCFFCCLHSFLAHLHVFRHCFHWWPLPLKSSVDHIISKFTALPTLAPRALCLSSTLISIVTHCVTLLHHLPPSHWNKNSLRLRPWLVGSLLSLPHKQCLRPSIYLLKRWISYIKSPLRF